MQVTKKLALVTIGLLIGCFFTILVKSSFYNFIDSKESITKAALDSIASKLESYKELCGTYPSIELGLEALVNPYKAGCDKGKELLSLVPLDDWDNEYFYFYDGKDYYLLSSLGGKALVTSKKK